MQEIQILPHEQWANIGLPNTETTRKYAVSSLGRVVSYTKTLDTGKLIAKEKPGKMLPDLTVTTTCKKRIKFKVHKLVAQYFLPTPPPSFNYVIHLDYNLANNKATNLMHVNYNMYLKHAKGENIKNYQPLKLFVGEIAKTVNENFSQKKYVITSYGRLISYYENISDGALINGSIHKEGYKIWRYKLGTKYKHHLIHRLVAEYFLDKPSPNHQFVIHLDHNKLNNTVSNLKWATQNEVTLHSAQSEAVITKRASVTNNLLKKGRGAKLTTGKVLLLKKILSNPNNPTRKRLLAKQFGISSMQLFRIQTGENWGWLQPDI